MSEKIWFTPELELDLRIAPKNLAIKGQVPRINYPFKLQDIYPITPALPAHLAYEKIREEFHLVNAILSQKLQIREDFFLPRASDDNQALSMLVVIFNPSSFFTDSLSKNLKDPRVPSTNIFRLNEVRPFALHMASPEHMTHSFVWIDVSTKVAVENALGVFNVPAPLIQHVVESVLKIYCYMIKLQEYHLARSINFNFSMFLQDRILHLILGDRIFVDTERMHSQGNLANDIALQLLKNLEPLSYQRLCILSVFMGVIWSSQKDVQMDFRYNPDNVLLDIEKQLRSKDKNWCINNIDQFLLDIGGHKQFTVTVVLDDNGESVFDIAIFQNLLRDNKALKVAFVVNRYPVVNNIDLMTFQYLISDSYFAKLRQFINEQRVEILTENQVFRSFEVSQLSAKTLRTIMNSRVTYIKGVSFFETFQLPNITRYHAFTVYGPTCILLTGCPERQGVFVRLSASQTAYNYHSHSHVEKLINKVYLVEEENHNNRCSPECDA